MKNTIIKTIIVFCAIMLLLPFHTNAQSENTRSSVIYLNGFGNSITYALTYDTRFTNAQNGFGGSIGVGAFALEGNYFVNIPLQVSYLFGEKINFFEIGAGVTYLSTNMHFINFGVMGKTSHNVLGSLNFMYRLQLPKGFFLRVGWTPIFGQFNTQEIEYGLPPNYYPMQKMTSESFFGINPLMGGIGLGYCIN